MMKLSPLNYWRVRVVSPQVINGTAWEYINELKLPLNAGIYHFEALVRFDVSSTTQGIAISFNSLNGFSFGFFNANSRVATSTTAIQDRDFIATTIPTATTSVPRLAGNLAKLEGLCEITTDGYYGVTLSGRLANQSVTIRPYSFFAIKKI